MLSPQLTFDELPETLQAAWRAATDPRDRFGDARAARDAEQTRAMVLEAALGFFDWLARTHGLPTDQPPGALVTRDRVAAWLASRPDLAAVTAYTQANALKLFVQRTDPAADTRPLQLLANAYRRAVPRSDLWKLQLPDPDTVIDHGLAMVAAGTAPPNPDVADARRTRDGLVIALMGWTPKRTADVARLTLGDHLRTFGGEARILVRPQKAGPRAATRGVPLPPDIHAAVLVYLACAWPVLAGATAPALPAHEDTRPGASLSDPAALAWGLPLWPSGRAAPADRVAAMAPISLSNRIACVTERELGQRLRPRTFRYLVATHLGRWAPAAKIATRLDHVSPGRTVTDVYRAPDRRAALARFALFD